MAFLKIKSTKHARTTYPPGQVIQTISVGPLNDTFTLTGDTEVTNPKIDCTGITIGNKCLISVSGQLSTNAAADASNHANIYLQGSGANMGIGEDTSGVKIYPEFGRETDDWAFYNSGFTVLSGALGVTNPTYQFYVDKTGSSTWVLYFTNWYITVQEIQQ